MYDNDFNMDGFGTMPASPYGEHGMDRSDTNNPLAFKGGVTVADPYPEQITHDIAIGRGSATSNYGVARTQARPAYGDLVSFVDTTDPRKTVYVYNTATKQITLPSGKVIGPGAKGYAELLAVYASQHGGGAQAGYAQAVQTALSNIAGGISAIPTAFAASQTFNTEAARLAQQQAALAAGGTGTGTDAATGTGTGTQQSGMPMWLWLVILAGGGLVVWSMMNKGSEK